MQQQHKETQNICQGVDAPRPESLSGPRATAALMKAVHHGFHHGPSPHIAQHHVDGNGQPKSTVLQGWTEQRCAWEKV